MKHQNKIPIPRLKKHSEEDFEKERQKIEQFRREHRRFMLAVYTIVLQVKLFLKKNLKDNVNALAGQSAFFLILSSVPLLMFVVALIALFGGKPDNATFQQTISDAGLTPGGGMLDSTTYYDYLISFLKEAYAYASSGLIIVTVVAALWSAGKGLYIITDGISRIYRLPLKHNWLIRRFFAMGYTVVVLLMMAVSFFLLILNAVFDAYIEKAVDGIPLTTEILYASRYLLATIIIALSLTLSLKLYLVRKVKEKRYIKFRVLLPGMAFTAIAWDVLTWGVSLYSKHFTSSIYGSLGAVFIVMMWIYFMMLLLLYGVQINYMYREVFYVFRIRYVFSAIKRKLRRNQKKAAS